MLPGNREHQQTLIVWHYMLPTVLMSVYHSAVPAVIRAAAAFRSLTRNGFRK